MISITTSTPVDNTEWEANQYVGRVQLGATWFNMITFSESPIIAIAEEYDVSDTPIMLSVEDNTLILGVSASLEVSAIDIYAEPIQAT